MDTDKYGRTVALVAVDGRDVNLSIIQVGYAWVYRKYCKADFCGDWMGQEESARSSGIGLWSDKKAEQPWEYRKNKR